MDLTSREKLLALGQGTWRRQQRLTSKTAHSTCDQFMGYSDLNIRQDISDEDVADLKDRIEELNVCTGRNDIEDDWKEMGVSEREKRQYRLSYNFFLVLLLFTDSLQSSSRYQSVKQVIVPYLCSSLVGAFCNNPRLSERAIRLFSRRSKLLFTLLYARTAVYSPSPSIDPLHDDCVAMNRTKPDWLKSALSWLDSPVRQSGLF